MNFFIKTEYNIIFIILLAIVSVLIAYFFYRRSHLEGTKKILFSTLRFLSVFFVLLLLSSPVISYINKDSLTPVNIFLIDNSQSLTIEGRDRLLNEKLNDIVFKTDPSASENRFFLFSGGLIKEIERGDETLPFNEINNFSTDLARSIGSLEEELSGKNVSSVSVISDGIINSGGNPSFTALSMNAPVNYYIIGDTAQKNDLVVRDIFYNKSAFIESSVPVNVSINSYGFDKTIKIDLYEEGKIIDSRMLTVSPSQNDHSVKFNVSSTSQGIKKYKIEVSPEDGEITLKNNYSEFFIKYIDNKFKVLLLAGSPSPDLAFISREIKKISNFETTFLTQKAPGQFYEGSFPEPDEYQVFLLLGYPTSASSPEILTAVKESIARNKSALFFFEARNVDHSKLAYLQEFLPFSIASASDIEEETGIRTVSSLNQEVFNKPGLLGSINGFPSVFKNKTAYAIKPSAETYLLSSRTSDPVLILQKTEEISSAAFLAHGIYKWQLHPGSNNSAEVLNYLITNTIINITDKEKQKKFFVETTVPVYSKFEDVIFTASLNPSFVTGGENIKIKISKDNFRRELDLRELNDLNFEGNINIPEDGDYYYTAELQNKGQFIESIEGRFSVGENNFEFRQTRADRTLLASLSASTGGADLSGMQASEIAALLSESGQKRPKEVELAGSLPLNINPFYLFTVIFLLGIEWFFRKRNNLP